MALEEYARKRRFAATPEPRGAAGKRAGTKPLSFVVQLHHASVRHYDFRLEVDGVLRSWAVPRGPSLRPGVKRLAVEVEDHPLDYASFEGDIPKGNYGAGHVAIFDQGTWHPEGDPADGVKRGKLEFELKGERLRGSWKLIRTAKAASKPQWLLLKRSDEFAGDVEADDMLSDIPAPPARTVSRRPAPSKAPGSKKSPAASSKAQSSPAPSMKSLLSNAAKASGAKRARAAPAWIEPMLATSAAKAPDGDDWLHEWKWDGYRLAASVSKGKVAITSRNRLPWQERLPRLVEALRSLGVDAAVDGELVSLNAAGQSDFNALQRALKSGDTSALSLVLFDLVRVGDVDLRDAPLVERKALLQQLVAKRGPCLGYSDHIIGHGEKVFEAAKKQKLEGIISKRVLSAYVSGRGNSWLKVKAVETREFAIVGYTQPKGSRSGLGALLLAEPEKKGWRYVGRVGSGLTDKHLSSLPKRLRAAKKPAVALPDHVALKERNVHWVEPDTVVEVIFRGWGKEGLLRQASFARLREDRDADSNLVQPENAGDARHAGRTGKARKTARPPATDAIPPPSSPDRLVYPDEGITKQQVFDFYLSVADRLLGELRDRPLSIVRCPDGIKGQHFFQKHAGPGFGAAVKRLPLRENDGDRAEYFYIDDVAGLMNLVQMNAIEFHPWGSRAETIEQPDRIVFDLDPDVGIEWKAIKAAAVEVRDRLRAAGLESWPRLTGGKGVHVVVPLEPAAKWPEARDFCEAFARAMSAEQPDRYVATASKAKRENRIFIDWLRNGRGATSVASWSLRARTGAPVAVPLTWEELARVRQPARYTLRDAGKRASPALVEGLEQKLQRLPRIK